jgi:beta-phosphoglucomutase-like phosphatase (HAD superfamily)
VSLLQRKRSNIDELEKEHDARIRNVVSEIAPLRGADRLLAHLRRSKVRFAIATTGNREQTSLLLKKLKIPAGTPEMAGWMLTFLVSMESAEVLAGLFRIRPDSKRTLS